MRLEGSSPPNFGRHYAEQIIAYLIINEYLKEDFNYTAYSTNSYIVKGGRKPGKEIIFNGSACRKLPPIEKLKKLNYDSPTQKTSKKRKIVESSEEEKESTSAKAKTTKINEPAISLKSENLEKIIDEKVKSTLDKYFREQKTDDSSDDDDCVIVTPETGVIKID